MSDDLIVQIEIIGTPGKNALYINGWRVAGSKPWGGGRTIEQWNVKQSELVNAIGNTQAARIAELEEALRNIAADCESDCPPSHGAIKYAARAALGGKDE